MENSNEYWPVDPKGRLDETVFDHSFILDVFYTCLPKAMNCQQTTIRKGLKSILNKKMTTRISKKDTSDVAITFCSNYACRQELKNVKLITDKANLSGGITKVPRKLGLNLSRCFFLYYKVQDEHKTLIEWAKLVSDSPKASQDTYYITAETLSKNIENNPCPIEFNSPEVARIMTLFAGVLTTTEQRIELLRQAALLGNTFLKLPNITQQKALQVKSEELVAEYPNLESVSKEKKAFKPSVNQTLKDLSESLDTLNKNHSNLCNVDTLTNATNTDFDKEIAKLKRYRENKRVLHGEADQIKKKYNEAIQIILDTVNNTKNNILKTQILEIKNIIDYVTLCDQIVQKYETLENNASLYFNNEKLLNVVDIDELDETLNDCISIDQKNELFFKGFRSFLNKSPDTSPNLIIEALQSWDNEAVFIIINKLNSPEFTPVAAAMIARCFEDANYVFPQFLSAYMLGDKKVFRNYFYFINPKNISKRETPELRSRILGELIVDSFLFENSDLLLDYYDNSSDNQIFGKNINEFINLLIEDNEFCNGGRSLISGNMENISLKEATKLVKSYLNRNSPNSFYTQLESLVSESLIKMVLANEIFSEKAAKELILDIKEGTLSEKVLDQFFILSSDSGWGKRYTTYIKFFISKFETFLREILIRCGVEDTTFSGSKTKKINDLLTKFSEKGPAGSPSELEGTVKELFKGDFNHIHNKTFVDDEEIVFERICTGDDNNWFLDFFGNTLSHLEDDVLLIDVVALNMEPFFSKPSVDDETVLDRLIAENKFSHALFFAEMAGAKKDLSVKKVKKAAEKDFVRYRNELSNLKSIIDETAVDWAGNQKIILNGMDRLEFEIVANQIQFLQNQQLDEAAVQKMIKAKEAQEKNIKHFRALILAAGTSVDEELSVNELEAFWTEELRQRSKERAHLIFVENSFCNLKTLPTEIEKRFNKFCSRILLGHYWLHPRFSNEYLALIKGAPEQLTNWLKTSGAYTDEENDALKNIFFWFFDFVESKSEAMHRLDAEVDNEEQLLQIMQATILITENIIPTKAYEAIKDEFPFFFEVVPSRSESGEAAPTIPESGEDVTDGSITATKNENNKTGTAEVIKKAINTSTEINIIDYNLIPASLNKYIQSESWEEAILYCQQNAYEEFSECLILIKQFLTSNEVVKISSIDALNFSKIVFSYPKISSLISEKNLLAIVFDLLCNVSHENNGSKKLQLGQIKKEDWAVVFSKNSKFLNILQFPIFDDTQNNLLVNIFSNKIAFRICEKLWLSLAKNPHAVESRAHFILFLNSLNFIENIVLLSGKFAPDVKSEVKNFLEARQTSLTQPNIASVARAFGKRIMAHFKSPNPFKTFVEFLPDIHEVAEPKFEVEMESELQFHEGPDGIAKLLLPITLSISNLILEKVEVVLVEDDDILFFEEGRVPRLRTMLADDAIYVSQEFTPYIQLGSSWNFSKNSSQDRSFKLRVRGKGYDDGKFYTKDLTCQVSVLKKGTSERNQITDDTLREFYPGITSSVIQQKEHFHGRVVELERLDQNLIARESPSPVLLTGMRRVGKTTLLKNFHARHCDPTDGSSVTVYFTISERRVALADPETSVSDVIWHALRYALTKRHNEKDTNSSLILRLKEQAESQGQDIKHIIRRCYSEESLADTILACSDAIISLLGDSCKRVIILVDEAEALVTAFQNGTKKRLELDQMFHSLREVSQSSVNTGILLSGSHHINIFATDYKSAFFGSCERIDLAGITDFDEARHLVAPIRVGDYIKFEKSAIQYAIDLCAGMPLFMWQVGALTSHLVKSGTARQGDVKRAVEIIVNGLPNNLFSAYDPLTPIEYDISLEPDNEPDFLWLLLYKIAKSSSLINPIAAKFTSIDQELTSLDVEKSWSDRLSKLIELKLIVPVDKASIKFMVPIFAHGFRASKNYENFRTREQRVS